MSRLARNRTNRCISPPIASQQSRWRHPLHSLAGTGRSSYRTPWVLHKVRQIAVLIALAGLIAVGSTSTTATALATTPGHKTANCSPGVPEKDCRTAEYVYKFAVSHNYAAPKGLEGNGEYRNETGLLPAGGDYREYRLYSRRGSSERLVIDRNNPEGNSWYTNDHYQPGSFVQFYLTL